MRLLLSSIRVSRLEIRAGIFVRRVQLFPIMEKNLQTLPSRANSRKSIFAKYKGVRPPLSGVSLITPRIDLTRIFFLAVRLPAVL
jgi:hypothetical protein